MMQGDDYPADSTTTGVLPIGGSVSAKFEQFSDSDWFKVHLDPGYSYSFASNRSDVTLYLVNASGVRVDTAYLLADGPSPLPTLAYSPEVGGDYFLGARGGTLGSYTIAATRGTMDDVGDTMPRAHALPLGVSETHQIDAKGDIDWYKVHMEGGRLYQLTLDPGVSGATFAQYLYQSEHAFYAFNSPYGLSPPVTSFLTLTGAAPVGEGDYYVPVRSLTGTGAYTVSLTALADDYGNTAASAGKLDFGTPLTGAIEAAHDQDWFKIYLEAGKPYQFQTTGVNVDLSLMVPTSGAPTEHGVSSPQELTMVNQSGYYYLQVAGTTPGTYTVTALSITDDIGNSTAAATVLQPGGALAGRIDYLGDVDVVAVPAHIGHVYEFTVTVDTVGGSPPKPLVLMGAANSFDPNPSMSLASTTQGSGTVTLRYQAMTDATAYLRIQIPNAMGAYHVSTTDLGPDSFGNTVATAGRIGLGATVVSHLESPGDLDYMTVALVGGVTYSIALSTGVGVSGPGAHASSDYRHVVVTPLYSGDYTFLVSSIDRQVHDYTVLVQASAADERSTGGHSVNGAASVVDVTMYSKGANDYTAKGDGHGNFVLTARGGASDTLSSIERVLFHDGGALALDLHGNAGEAYRLYQAAFDRQPDSGGLGFWINKLDHGLSVQQAAAGFMGSAEFQHLYGSAPTDAQFVDHLYQNVLHRPGEAAGVAYWLDVLHGGAARPDVLAAFSDSAENVSAVAAIIGNGIWYTPYV